MRRQRNNARLPRNQLGKAIFFALAILALGLFGWHFRPHQRKKAAAQTKALPATAQPIKKIRKPKAPEPLAVSQPDYPRPVQTVFEAQLALDRQGISCGSLDGKLGPQTRAAIRAFQQKMNLPETGELDPETKTNLLLASPPFTTYVVSSNDLAQLQPLSPTWLGKSQQSALAYQSILEMVAEKSHSHPNLIRQLNPGVDWAAVAPGTVLQVPESGLNADPPKAAFVVIRLSEKTLEAFDAESNLLAHFPCSIARHVEKRPVGELHVEVIVPHPNYTFDPALFPESPEARDPGTKLILPPGPNNPVGTVWIGLDLPGYGIHGTPVPENVGRTESHGCFRLANWNAELLMRLAWMGMPVYVEP